MVEDISKAYRPTDDEGNVTQLPLYLDFGKTLAAVKTYNIIGIKILRFNENDILVHILIFAFMICHCVTGEEKIVARPGLEPRASRLPCEHSAN